MTDKETIDIVDNTLVRDFVDSPESYYYGLALRFLLLGNYEEARHYLNKLIAYITVEN